MEFRGVKWAVAVGALVCVVAFAGCSSSSSSDSASTCKDLQNLATQVRGLQDVNIVQTGVDGLQKQVDAIDTAWQQAKDSGGEQFGTQLDALESSLNALGSTLTDAASGGQSISSVLSSVSSDIEKVSTAWTDLTSSVDSELSGCSLSA